MSKSVKRVKKAIGELGLTVSVQRMPETTRTAQDAAVACGCEVGQIVKSMIFEGVETGKLKLLLVSGQHDVDLTKAPELFGEPLTRADPKRVRSETGFAIGGVSPTFAIEGFSSKYQWTSTTAVGLVVITGAILWDVSARRR